jgi:hypothetical protein
MDRESGSAGFDRIVVAARPPVLFGELRKRNRRRVFQDPASEFIYAGIVHHGLVCHRRIAMLRLLLLLLGRLDDTDGNLDGCSPHLPNFVSDGQYHNVRPGSGEYV